MAGSLMLSLSIRGGRRSNVGLRIPVSCDHQVVPARRRVEHKSLASPLARRLPTSAKDMALLGRGRTREKKERYSRPEPVRPSLGHRRTATRVLESSQDGLRARHPRADPPSARLDGAQYLGYIAQEQIPVIDLYFDQGRGPRYRSLGCGPCTAPVESHAASVHDIIVELRSGRFAHVAERSGRAQDAADGGTLETLARDG